MREEVSLDDITWLGAQLPESSPPLLLLWLLAASCQARMVPSSATNQRGWNPAGARWHWKSQRSRKRQRRRPARRTVRVQKLKNKLRCFTSTHNKTAFFTPLAIFSKLKRSHAAVIGDGPDEYAWDRHCCHDPVCQTWLHTQPRHRPPERPFNVTVVRCGAVRSRDILAILISSTETNQSLHVVGVNQCNSVPPAACKFDNFVDLWVEFNNSRTNQSQRWFQFAYCLIRNFGANRYAKCEADNYPLGSFACVYCLVC